MDPRMYPESSESAGLFQQIVYNTLLRLTIAQVNAGYAACPARSDGRKYRITDMKMSAEGGAAAGATGVYVDGVQAGSTVHLWAVAVAALTDDALVQLGTSNSTLLANSASFRSNDANQAIRVVKNGNDVTTATHINVWLSYVLER